MSVGDKLQAMEQLWADLSQNPEHVASPAWHGEVRRSRRKQVLQGLCGTGLRGVSHGMENLTASLRSL